jgi:hypothetical protein
MNLINSVNLIISLENKILTTKQSKKKKNNNNSMQKMHACQYCENKYSQYSKSISIILFVNKIKIKWK